jgi:hypothetical protein
MPGVEGCHALRRRSKDKLLRRSFNSFFVDARIREAEALQLAMKR